MSILNVENLKFGYLDDTVFKNASFKILNGEHIGLVGINGCGKSTFMNLIAHKLHPDNGTIEWDKNISFSYLDQHLKVYDDLTIKDYLYDVYSELYDKEKEMNDLYDSLVSVDESKYDKIISKAEAINEYLEEKGFYMIKSRISNVINGLGIDDALDRNLKDLSSGQRGKIFLGKMLLEEKDVLLLDEPTNFLDASHVEWLSKYLINYKHEFVVISHDQVFLNNVCNVIYAVDNKSLVRYKGNYEDYLKLKDIRRKEYEASYVAQQKYIKKTEDFINRNLVRASTTKRAQSRRKELEKIVRIEKPTHEVEYHFEFPFSNSFNVDSVKVKDLVIGYNKPLLKPINLDIHYGDRIVILGANGVGKSTFLKTILGFIKPLDGSFKYASYNKLLYFEQEYHGDLSITPLEYFKAKYPSYEDKKIRSILGKYGITGDLAIKKFSELSGGEITKVRFSLLCLNDSNLLVLDEPTNHLDKHAKTALKDAICEYPGTVIIVSHEKEFYKELNCREIVFDKIIYKKEVK